MNKHIDVSMSRGKLQHKVTFKKIVIMLYTRQTFPEMPSSGFALVGVVHISPEYQNQCH